MNKRCETILKELEKEGKIKVWWDFKFPEKEPLKLRLKDMLEDEVDEKYYLSDMQVNKIKTSNFMQEKKRIQDKEYSNTMQGGNKQPTIITHNIQQTVMVRKYPVDTDNLKIVLRIAKLCGGLNNKEIANKLNIPQTQVEHYFRTDNSFAIPSPEIWFKLKEILGITTNEFDESVMTFEEKEGVYEKANRVYDEQGLAPTLTQQEEKILIKNATKKGYDEAVEGDSINLSYPDSATRRGRVGHGVSQTLQCNDSIGCVVNERN